MDISKSPINKANDIELAKYAYQEFCNAADYIWKIPRFIDAERKNEMSKLDEYFSGMPELANLRWQLESRKLENTFPYLMNVGNLFATASLYETYLLRLVKELEKSTDTQLSTVHGQGSSRIKRYFKIIGLDYSSVPLHPQIDAALKIRNCLIHASGILSWAKNEKNLRQILSSSTFLSPIDLDKYVKNNSPYDEVRIIKSSLGERIQISNGYTHLACSYFRDYFIGLCIESKKFI